MASPLVATKLRVPKLRPEIVERPRLDELLLRGEDARLTLISAPAGFGKTTMLASWVAASRGKGSCTAWLSLDPADNEPSMFWPHVVASVQRAAADAGTTFPDLPASAQPDRSFLAVLVNEMAEIDVALDLIVDDFHLLDHPQIHADMGFLIEHLPPHIHVVISTRADPDLPLARLRARGDLVEIRATDLRFTGAETVAFLNGLMGLGLRADDTTRLGERTEGWIAALQLAALSLRGRPDASAFIAEFAGSGRYILDYLIEEVLQHQPEDVRRFLLATCMLGRMTGSLCDVVTGTAGGREMLDRLDRQNLFVVPLDDRRQWYRYHHLFADVLLSHLSEEDWEKLAPRHRIASQWFEANGERAEAIGHALSGKDFEWAAELVERAIPDMRKHRQEAAFRLWMKSIPEALVRSRPVLNVGYAGVLMSLGEFDGMDARLLEAEQRLSEAGDPRTIQASIEVYRTALAQIRGDLPAAVQHAERVLALASEDDHLTRASAAGFLGIVSWSRGDLAAALRHWTDCRDGLLKVGHIADVLGTTIAISDILATQGRLTEAVLACQQALDLATANGRSTLRGTADMYASLAVLLVQRNDLAAARLHIGKSIEFGDLLGLPQHPYRSRVAQAQLAAAEGRLEAAIELLDEAEQRYVSDYFPNVRPIPALRARLSLRLGRLGEALRWSAGSGVTTDDTLSYVAEFDHITLARINLAQAGHDRDLVERALSLLDRLHDDALAGGRGASAIELSILKALAHRLLNDMPAALACLQRALELAEPQGLVRIFLDEGEPILALLKLAVKSGVAPICARRLIAAADENSTGTTAAHPDLIEPLSDREVDVLRLLRTELSGPDMARELALSLNTVRTHTKNIYEKLGVSGRRAAVRRAEELDLFARRSSR